MARVALLRREEGEVAPKRRGLIDAFSAGSKYLVALVELKFAKIVKLSDGCGRC